MLHAIKIESNDKTTKQKNVKQILLIYSQMYGKILIIEDVGQGNHELKISPMPADMRNKKKIRQNLIIE